MVGRFDAGPRVASPASALLTCNSNDDCWQNETRLTYPGATFSYHDDAWRDAHREDKAFRWHETDNDHDWHHGYWEKGITWTER